MTATIVRVVRPQRWTTLDRRPINDSDLSYRARGVLVWLLDKPDDTRVNASEISKHGTEGRDAVETALRELRQAGYLITRKVQVEKGQWATENCLYEHPSLAPPPATDSQGPAPSPGKPAPDNQGLTTESTTPENCADQVVAETHDGSAAARAALRASKPTTTHHQESHEPCP